MSDLSAKQTNPTVNITTRTYPHRAKNRDKIELKIVKQDKIEKQENEKKYRALMSYISFWARNVPYISFWNALYFFQKYRISNMGHHPYVKNVK